MKHGQEAGIYSEIERYMVIPAQQLSYKNWTTYHFEIAKKKPKRVWVNALTSKAS